MKIGGRQLQAFYPPLEEVIQVFHKLRLITSHVPSDEVRLRRLSLEWVTRDTKMQKKIFSMSAVPVFFFTEYK